MVQKVKKIKKGNIITINVVSDNTSKNKERKLYEIDESKKEVRVFHRKYGTNDDFYVTFEGFKRIPDIFSETKNTDDGTLDSIQGHIERYHYKKLIISKSRDNQVDGENLIINYDKYKLLLEEIKSIKNRTKTLKQRERSKFLKNSFPEIFSSLKTSFPSISNSISREIIDEEVLKRLEYKRLLDIVQVSSNVIEKKHGKKLVDFHRNITVISSLPILKKAAKDLVKLMSSRNKKECDFSQYLISTFPLMKFDCVHLEKNLNLICAGAKKNRFFNG